MLVYTFVMYANVYEQYVQSFCMLFCICIHYANGHNSDRRDGMKSNMQGIGGGSGDFGGGSGILHILIHYV